MYKYSSVKLCASVYVCVQENCGATAEQSNSYGKQAAAPPARPPPTKPATQANLI